MLHRGERIGGADARARQPLELLDEARQLARAAGDEDLGDRKRAGLGLVELKRGDEFARQRLNLPLHGRTSRADPRVVALGSRRLAERD